MKSLNTLLIAGIEATQNKKYTKAVEIFNQALSLHGGKPPCLL